MSSRPRSRHGGRRNLPKFTPSLKLFLQPHVIYKGVVARVGQKAASVDIGFGKILGILPRSRVAAPSLKKFFNKYESTMKLWYPKTEDCRDVLQPGDVIEVVASRVSQRQIDLERAPADAKSRLFLNYLHSPGMKKPSSSSSSTSSSSVAATTNATSPAESKIGSCSSSRSPSIKSDEDLTVFHNKLIDSTPTKKVYQHLSSNLQEAETKKKVTRKRLEALKVGTVLEGHVKNVLHFGAFVDIGATKDGLIPLGCLRFWNNRQKESARSSSGSAFSSAGDILRRGDRVEVLIESIDKRRKRIGLDLLSKGNKAEGEANPLPVPNLKDPNEFPPLK